MWDLTHDPMSGGLPIMKNTDGGIDLTVKCTSQRLMFKPHLVTSFCNLNLSNWKIASWFFPVLLWIQTFPGNFYIRSDWMKDKKKDTNDEDFEQSELSDAPEDDRDCKGDDADEDITYPHLC